MRVFDESLILFHAFILLLFFWTQRLAKSASRRSRISAADDTTCSSSATEAAATGTPPNKDSSNDRPGSATQGDIESSSRGVCGWNHNDSENADRRQGAEDSANETRHRGQGSFFNATSDSDSDHESIGSFSYGYGHTSTGSMVGDVGYIGGAYYGGDGGGGGGADDGGRGRAGSEGHTLGGLAGADELAWLERARARTAEVLQERKKMKRRLGLAAERFNTGAKGWLEYAQACTEYLVL